MNTQFLKYILITTLTFALASTASAKPGGGKGGGGGGKDGGGGSGGIVPISITFRDDPVYDRVGSDIVTPYVDAVSGVEAFIGSKANTGNVWLRLAQSDRGLYLDFTDCFDSPDYSKCTSPFAPYKNSVVSISAIKLDANDVLSGGILSMVLDDTISAPLRIYYQFEKGAPPGFIEFNPSVKGGSPCKNKSNHVTVIRISDTSWEVSAEPFNRACATLPGGEDLSGVYVMPFSFTVKIL